ncbi:MAG: UDP-N-acetylmuramate--L-alanine ligase [Deltaproteobacteria bacterium]|nr:UDP-N-acetylmuramate--L-alanine ligase [Deltaproteobacteria bacterium]MBW1934148.1 UDP-N-acetylmuramate--L-alanine ligase [Deltaproteobacteria bacterium]MBW1977149.1 UDP-N-acetylmuramate--L-alanine ligase [Deltaproteobacteria bacterium]MBW2043596.1 UDP-N-acetylmuramate--L-alanine ligase [Deltaproteobacteria bacterium]MBW2299050.1 UDP-N-acetylmuramate--L-alanine ligase [Deltaproteobacteria bacterium]
MQTFGKAKHIHFVGIGGIGMSGIAELLLNLGYDVSGSDLKDSAVTGRLSDLGGKIFLGHRKENVRGADVVVYSSAIPEDNPELVEAREKYIPVIPRAEMLAELMRLKYGIAVAGAHGKTTTTSMIGSILTAAGLDPTVVIGGRLDIWGGSNAKLGQGEILVAESDESDGSFTVLSPTMSVVTNIDYEHMDHYNDMDALREAFVSFVNKIPFYGLAVLCLDCEEIQGIIPHLKKRYLTYGMSSQADLRAREVDRSDLATGFEVVYRNHSLGRVVVGMPGYHNVLNALAAIGVGLELDIGLEDISRGLKDLGGLARRFHVKGEKKGVLVIDDYGHHPTEIVATLETARECWPERRLVVVFQPHRYSRTKLLFDRFVISFNDADSLILAPIYPAGERPIEGVSSEGLFQGIKEHGHKDVVLCSTPQEILAHLSQKITKGDVVITLGAGDIYHIGESLLEKLSR